MSLNNGLDLIWFKKIGYPAHGSQPHPYASNGPNSAAAQSNWNYQYYGQAPQPTGYYQQSQQSVHSQGQQQQQQQHQHQQSGDSSGTGTFSFWVRSFELKCWKHNSQEKKITKNYKKNK